MTKIIFIINKQRIQTLQELRDNFNLLEVLLYYKNGRLAKWLEQVGETEYQKAVEQLDITQEDMILNNQLRKILGIQDSSATDFELAGRFSKEGNKTEAVKWYRNAAEQGHADAQYKLGVCYNTGDGIAQNKTEAVKWYRKAAEQGHADAQYNFWTHHLFDSRVKKDWTHHLFDSRVEKDKNKAIEYFNAAAKQGHADAQYELAQCYQDGEGVSKDQAEAVKWFTKALESYRNAAEQGNADAQYRLGECYQYGYGVSQNEREALKWYVQAAKQGHADAQYELGKCYQDGKGVSKDERKAIRWLTLAMKKGHCLAESALKELEDPWNLFRY